MQRNIDSKKIIEILTAKDAVKLSSNIEPAMLLGTGQYVPPSIDQARADRLQGVQKYQKKLY